MEQNIFQNKLGRARKIVSKTYFAKEKMFSYYILSLLTLEVLKSPKHLSKLLNVEDYFY